MDQTAIDENPSAKYLLAIKENALWIILFVVIAVGVVFAMTSRQPPVYESHVQIILERQSSTAVSTVNTLNLLLGSDDFLSRIISDNNLAHSKAELRSSVHGEHLPAPDQKAIVNIYVQDSQARVAKKLADMIAKQFVLETRRFVVEQVPLGDSFEGLPTGLINDEPVKPQTLVEKISGLDKEIAALKEELSRIENSEIEDTAKATYVLALTPRLSRFEDLRIAAQSEGAQLGQTQIIAPASLPTVPIYPRIFRTLMIALVAAVIFGCTLAIARETFR